MIGCCSLIIISIGRSMYRFDLCEQQQSDYVMGNFWSAHWPQSHFRHHLLMCRHLPDGGKLTPDQFSFYPL